MEGDSDEPRDGEVEQHDDEGVHAHPGDAQPRSEHQPDRRVGQREERRHGGQLDVAGVRLCEQIQMRRHRR